MSHSSMVIVKALTLAVALGLTVGCEGSVDSEPWDDEERLVSIKGWHRLLDAIEDAEVEVEQAHDLGTSVGLNEGCVLESDTPTSLCLLLDDDPSFVGRPDHTSFAGLVPSAAVTLHHEDTTYATQLWLESGSGEGRVACMEMSIELEGGATELLYADCLAGGGALWIDVVLDAHLPSMRTELVDGLAEAGASSSLAGQTADALLSLLRTASSGAFEASSRELGLAS